MTYFENARSLISRDKIHETCTLLNAHFTGEDRNAVFLLENQLSHWENRVKTGPDWSMSEHHRIAFALLVIISDVEKREQPSIQKDRQREIEKLLERSFEKVSTLEKPINKTDEALAILEKGSPEYLEQLKNLSAAFQAPGHGHIDAPELIDYWESQVLNSAALSNSDTKLLSHLLASSPTALLSLLNERRHRQASIRLLEERINTYKAKYEKIKTAGIAAAVGAWLGSVFLGHHEQSVFGKGYDERGYNMKGYDFDGFDQHGHDAQGQHFIEGASGVDSHHTVADHGDLHDHNHHH